MPRHARLDAPGALHQVICRGIERQPIVRDDTDRAAFVELLGRVVAATGTPCYAWALLPNHVHLLLRTGAVPLTTVMRRLLTGYAGAFNRHHHRHGYSSRIATSPFCASTVCTCSNWCATSI